MSNDVGFRLGALQLVLTLISENQIWFLEAGLNRASVEIVISANVPYLLTQNLLVRIFVPYPK